MRHWTIQMEHCHHPNCAVFHIYTCRFKNRHTGSTLSSGRGHQNSVNHLPFLIQRTQTHQPPAQPPLRPHVPASIMFKYLKVTTVQNPSLQRGTNKAMKHAQLFPGSERCLSV